MHVLLVSSSPLHYIFQLLGLYNDQKICSKFLYLSSNRMLSETVSRGGIFFSRVNTCMANLAFLLRRLCMQIEFCVVVNHP